jgi:BTB/POZ domain
MARNDNGNIGDTTAKTFAEYVVTVPGPTSAAPQRPSLLFRIHSHRLRVQANAKSLRERLLSGPMVDVYVGEARRHWSLHRNLLSYHSGAIRAELEPSPDSTPKSKTRDPHEVARLELPDVEPCGFELYVKWLYQGKLEDVSDISGPQEKYSYAVACYNLHVLCSRFDMPKLKNIAMDQYCKGLNQAGLVPDADELNDIYRRSPEGSPFRRLMVKIAARQIMDPGGDKDAESYRKCFEGNPDFAIDLVNSIKAGTGGVLFDDPTEEADCEYHDHDNGPNCHVKGKGKLGN